jgi:hypothetical protein
MLARHGAGLNLCEDRGEARKVNRCGKREPSSRLPQNRQAIQAELHGSTTATAGRITATRHVPVLALCRLLIAAGHDPRPAARCVPRRHAGLAHPINRRGRRAGNQRARYRFQTGGRRGRGPAGAPNRKIHSEGAAMTDAPKSLDDIAAHIRAPTGVTDNDRRIDAAANTSNERPTTAERIEAALAAGDSAWALRILIRDAAEFGKHCAGCGHEFTPGDPVWRFFTLDCCASGRTFAPHCQQCRNPKWVWSDPQPCEGCGHPVHLPEWRRWRKEPVFICCADCGKRTRNKRRRFWRSAERFLTCASCGEGFEPKRNDARFCSGRCRQWHYRRRRVSP